MTESHERTRYIAMWETVAVTALPLGWFNVYAEDDGGHIHVPCPALLLQERRETMRCWDTPRGDGTFDVRTETTPHDPPYETRVMFADFDGAELGPANGIGNYVETIYVAPKATP